MTDVEQKRNNELFIYEICVTGYECYAPCLFATNLSREQFEQELKLAYESISSKLLSDESFIQGHEILRALTKYLTEKGLRLVKPNHVYDLNGECIYYADDEKPESMPQELWEKIIKHNDKIREEMYSSLKEAESIGEDREKQFVAIKEMTDEERTEYEQNQDNK